MSSLTTDRIANQRSEGRRGDAERRGHTLRDVITFLPAATRDKRVEQIKEHRFRTVSRLHDRDQRTSGGSRSSGLHSPAAAPR